MSKARNLSDFISDATIDATEIADGAVTAAKLHTSLDLSSKTVTFADDHISGNKIHGGVISGFASTGIDDNATATALTINSSGYVGIGGAPENELDVRGTVEIGNGSTQRMYLQGSGTDFRFYDRANSTERMRINSSGYVGIGTSSPAKKFAVSNSNANGIEISPDDPTTSTNRILSYNRSTSAFTPLSIGADDIRFYIEDAEKVRIDSSGNVGIGTTSPSENLHVFSSSGNADAKFESTAAGSDARLFVRRNGNASRAYLNFSDSSTSANWYAGLLRLTDNSFAIGRGDDYGTNTDLVITNTGNVGIGTTTPGYELEVVGTTRTDTLSCSVQSLGSRTTWQYNSVGRYRISGSLLQAFMLKITVLGTNYSLGTNDRRHLEVYINRRYNGAYSIDKIFGQGQHFYGTTANFSSAGVGVLVETSSTNEMIIQVHNSSSNGPNSQLRVIWELVGMSSASYNNWSVLATHNSGYTTNPF